MTVALLPVTIEWARQRFGDRWVDEKIENKTIEVDDGSKTKN